MALLSISNLRHSYGDRAILDGVNLTLIDGEHVGLVGINGCGKSTLMKIIAGLPGYKHDDGQVQLTRGARVGYLSQDHNLNPDNTLRQEAGAAYEQLARLHRKLDKVSHEMETAEGDALQKLLEKYERLQQEMEAAGGYAVDHKIDATLHGLGLSDELFNVKVADLSGGQKGRLSLAKLLLAEPDLLLLDEPTNHLDIDGRRWLEEYLATYRGAVMLISHDRWLLDRSVVKIYEMSMGRMEEYPGNYQKYRELRAERHAFRLREYEKQQDRFKREQAFIDRYRAGQRARQAQGREKRLERMQRDDQLEKPMTMDTINMRLKGGVRGGDSVVLAENVAKNYDSKRLFNNLSVHVKRGDRIGIIGPNGAGKSTLVSCLLGKTDPDNGMIRVGSQIDVGYYHQSHDHLDNSQTVVEYLQRVTGHEQSARDLAGAFLFSGMDQDKPLGVMSGGERGRTILAGLVAGGHNLLVLDEPSNHLDIPSAERLEEALRVYAQPPKGFGESITGGGTLILITHDRMLLDNTVDQLLVFDGKGGVKHFIGSYSEYLAATQGQAASAPGAAVSVATASKPKPTAAQPVTPKQSKPKANRRFSALNDSKLEAKVAHLTSTIQTLDQQLADPAIYRDGSKVREIQHSREKLALELKEFEEEWLSRNS